MPVSKLLNVEKKNSITEKVEKLSLSNITNMEISEKDSLKSAKGLSIFTPTEINTNVLLGKQVFNFKSKITRLYILNQLNFE